MVRLSPSRSIFLLHFIISNGYLDQNFFSALFHNAVLLCWAIYLQVQNEILLLLLLSLLTSTTEGTMTPTVELILSCILITITVFVITFFLVINVKSVNTCFKKYVRRKKMYASTFEDTSLEESEDILSELGSSDIQDPSLFIAQGDLTDPSMTTTDHAGSSSLQEEDTAHTAEETTVENTDGS